MAPKQRPPREPPAHDAAAWVQQFQEQVSQSARPRTRPLRVTVQTQTLEALHAYSYLSVTVCW